MKKMFSLLLILMLYTASALADPLALQEDYSCSISVPCDENDPSAGNFVYSYRYPHVDGEAEDSAAINAFFETEAEMEDFRIEMYYGDNSSTELSYTVTCNNDDFFSVLVKKNCFRSGSAQINTKQIFHIHFPLCPQNIVVLASFYYRLVVNPCQP